MLDPRAPAEDARLLAIDHVAMGLAPDRVDTWVLFCRAVLDLEAGDSLNLADPYGLVRSFGMADAARRLRFVLNASLSQRTRTAQAATASGGAGVHHIAFRAADIFGGPLAALQGRGVRADLQQLPRRLGYAVRHRSRTDEPPARRGHLVRPHERWRLPPRLHRALHGPLLLRDRPAAGRLRWLRRTERRSAHGIAGRWGGVAPRLDGQDRRSRGAGGQATILPVAQAVRLVKPRTLWHLKTAL